MRRLYLVGLLLLVLTGCQVDTSIDINAQANGSGSIEVRSALDAEAAKGAPNLETQLADSDLKRAGWNVVTNKESDGRLVVTAKHNFSSVSQADTLMQQLTGSDGPFKGFRLTQTRSLTSVSTEFSGTADLSKGIESFGSPELQQRFGNGFGFDTNELEQSTGVDLAKTFPISVAVHIPGDSKNVSPQRSSDGTWHLQYGQSTQLTASASGPNVRALGAGVIALVFLLAAVAVAIFWRTYIPKHREGKLSAAEFAAQLKEHDDDEL